MNEVQVAWWKKNIADYHQYRDQKHAKDDKAAHRVMGSPLVTSYEEVKDSSQRGDYAEIYYPDHLCGKMSEVVPDYIHEGIKPQDSRQSDKGNETR